MACEDAEGVCGDVDPGEAGAEDEVAEGVAAEVFDPGGVIELAEFDGDAEGEGDGGDPEGGAAGEEESDGEEDHEGPEGVAGFFAEDGREMRGKVAGGEACENGEEDKNCVEEAGAAWMKRWDMEGRF